MVEKCTGFDVETAVTGESQNPVAVSANTGRWLESVRVWLPKFSTATALTALAGFNDAVGYSALGHLYLSFMSGNSTHLGMSFAGRDWYTLLVAGSIILMFVAGTTIGTLIGDRFPQPMAPRILGIELVIVLGAAAGSYLGLGAAALVPIAGAMGMQNVLHQNITGADVGKGFISGSLFGLGQSLARLARDRGQCAAAFQNGWSWLSFIAGVSTGALAYSALGLSFSLCAGAIALSAILVLTRYLSTER